MNIVFLALFLIVHNPADAATPNKPFLIYICCTVTIIVIIIKLLP